MTVEGDILFRVEGALGRVHLNVPTSCHDNTNHALDTEIIDESGHVNRDESRAHTAPAIKPTPNTIHQAAANNKRCILPDWYKKC